MAVLLLLAGKSVNKMIEAILTLIVLTLFGLILAELIRYPPWMEDVLFGEIEVLIIVAVIAISLIWLGGDLLNLH